MTKLIELTLASGGRLILNVDHIAAIREASGDNTFADTRSTVSLSSDKFSVKDDINSIKEKIGLST